MGRNEHCRTTLGGPTQGFRNNDGVALIEAACRLVCEDDVHAGCYGACDSHALLLSPR
jgi:hypothetical protein